VRLFIAALAFDAATGFGLGNAIVGMALLSTVYTLLGGLKAVVWTDVAQGTIFALGALVALLGLAFYLGKPLIQPQAPQIPALPLGAWSDSPALQTALQVNALLPLGVLLAVALHFALQRSRAGLLVRLAGDSALATRALGHQGLIAVALVIFARWQPVRCLWAALLFGGAGALGPALQSIGVSGDNYLFNAVPYALTLAILVWTCSPRRSLQGAPMELGVTR